MPPGFPIPRLKFTYVTLVVDDVLSGVPDSLDPGTITMRFAADVRGVEKVIPDHSHLLFLLNSGQIAKEDGHSEEVQETWRYVYLPATSAGIFRDIDGSAMVTPDRRCCSDSFPGSLDGDSFDGLVERVRDRIAGP